MKLRELVVEVGFAAAIALVLAGIGCAFVAVRLQR